MEIQFHPASGRRGVRTILLSPTGLRAAAGGGVALLLLTCSLFVTAPAVVSRVFPPANPEAVLRERRAIGEEAARADLEAGALKQRALLEADLLSRIAFLYEVTPRRWPRALAPERGLLARQEAERIASGLETFLRVLERGRAILEEREGEDRALSDRVPARVPLAGEPFEPSAFFGPRRSPWTGQEEFSLGADIAAAASMPVVAPGAGTVVFAGTARRSSSGWFWRLGNMIVISHGASGATVLGHLSRIDVRRGQSVLRGQRLGAVGATGWAISPQLHYEYWRPAQGGLRPTDPLFAVLDRRLGRSPLSLDQMLATSAPGPLDPLPGIQAPADRAEAPQRASPPSRAPRRQRHRRI